MTMVVFDPGDPSTVVVEDAAVGYFGRQVGATVLHGVHHSDECLPHPCVIHRPSDHGMRGFRLSWRDDRGLMERICPHGVGHPDPDSLAWHERQGRAWMGVHGCCHERCCS